MTEEIPQDLDVAARDIVDAAFKVHTTLGPGLLESVYEMCLHHELRLRGHNIQTQVPIPVRYEGLILDGALKLDLLVDDRVIVELKAVDVIHPVFEARLLTYTKLTGCRLGLLINFNVSLIKNGIKRMAL